MAWDLDVQTVASTSRGESDRVGSQYYPMEAFVRAESPDVLFHLAIASQPTGRASEGWRVSYEWSSELPLCQSAAGSPVRVPSGSDIRAQLP